MVQLLPIIVVFGFLFEAVKIEHYTITYQLELHNAIFCEDFF